MLTVDDDLGFVYLAEETSPDDRAVTNLKYNDSASSTYAEFDTVLQTFRTMNRNHRCYLGQNINDNLKTERIQSMLATNGWFGEMDHPQDEYENAKLTPQRIKTINMKNRSHKIIAPVVNGDIMTAKIQTASGTEAGRGMAAEIIQGLIPCFSCRAIATLQNIDGKPTVIVRLLVTYDWVLYPSHKEAMMQNKAEMKTKSIPVSESVLDPTPKKNIFESAFQKFGKWTQDVQLPLHEIMDFVGNKDANMQLILESFDLDESSIVGFDPMLEHAIVKDDNNQLFVKMSPRTKKEVKNFLSSF